MNEQWFIVAIPKWISGVSTQYHCVVGPFENYDKAEDFAEDHPDWYSIEYLPAYDSELGYG
jgi:hypothetical protein